MGLLSGAEILAAADAAFEDVPVPEWGGTVRVRTLRAEERRQFERMLGEKPELSEINSRTILVGLCLCDEAGKPLFTPDQFKALADKSALPIIRLFEVCKRLNCLGTAEDEAEKKSPTPATS